MSKAAQKAIDSWIGEPHNTARSVLATIFGDTVAPVGGSVWLAQLFQLTDVFGLSPRLVRTSLYRLASEGWCTNERVGRQSKYSLTQGAALETQQAEERIYQLPDPEWSGEWTAAFVDSPSLSEEARQRIVQRLGWQGFLPLRSGMLVSPTATVSQAKAVCDRAAPNCTIALATMTFPELEDLVTNGFFVEALSIEHRAKAYEDFIALYEPLSLPETAANPQTAFGVRTMLVHDLRRIRLSGPDIPAQLLPDDWPGTRSFELARRLYPALSTAASPWLSTVLDVNYPATFESRLS